MLILILKQLPPYQPTLPNVIQCCCHETEPDVVLRNLTKSKTIRLSVNIQLISHGTVMLLTIETVHARVYVLVRKLGHRLAYVNGHVTLDARSESRWNMTSSVHREKTVRRARRGRTVLVRPCSLVHPFPPSSTSLLLLSTVFLPCWLLAVKRKKRMREKK